MFERLWKSIWLKNVHYNDAHWRLKLLYRSRDPWCMENPKERHRFVVTSHFIQERLGSVGRLLEIGCGEGHQSVYLSQLCDKHYGIDVSKIAISRARRRCVNGVFHEGTLEDCEFVRDESPFDLVTACEVLYYMKDIPDYLSRLSQIARHVVVSYHLKRADMLDRYFISQRGLVAKQVDYEDTSWKLLLYQA